jgi:hypothetical protein
VSFPFDLHSAAVFDSHTRPIHTYHAMICVNQTRPYCVNQIGKNGMAGERHGMCESCAGMAPAMGWKVRGSNPDCVKNFRTLANRSSVPPRGSFADLKRLGHVDHSPPSSAEIKHNRAVLVLPPCLHGRC